MFRDWKGPKQQVLTVIMSSFLFGVHHWWYEKNSDDDKKASEVLMFSYTFIPNLPKSEIF